jgi:hypothetical protein
MDPKLLEILKKAKQIDKAAEKFDTGAIKKSSVGGLMDSMGGSAMMLDEGYSTPLQTVRKDVGSENYNQAVKSSKLPPAIQKAMLENPIPQPSTGFDVDEDAIRALRENDGPSYREDDEVDMYQKPVRRTETQKKRPINENVSPEAINIDEKYLRKLIASELTKALPKIIENYFDSRLVKENVQFKAGNTIFSGTVMPMPKVKGKNNI